MSRAVPGSQPVVDVVVVGAGFAGLYMLHKLRELGVTARAYERGSDVGGTWYWNRYPGARCDVESFEYSFSFDPEIEQSWVWTHKYAEQSEILAYIRYVADRLDLRRFISFDNTVIRQSWDEEKACWTVETDTGEIVWARFCVMASGNLTTPNVPPFEGVEQFEGRWVHTSRWPQEGLDVAGKRVAQIGTGSTGIQLAPQLAKAAAHLYVFQRTANFSVPARNRPVSADEDAEYKAGYREVRRLARQSPFGSASIPAPTLSALSLAPEERDRVFEERWASGGTGPFQAAFTDILTSPEANASAAEFVRRKIREIVRNPATAELLSPSDHPLGAKRLCLDTDYFETFNRPNVTLVDAKADPIVEITANGIRTKAQDYPVDIIVFATGFDAMTGALREIDIRGRDGRSLTEAWEAGPVNYLGLAVAGFPNLFVVTGPGSPSVKSNMVFSIEQHVEWIGDLIRYLDDHGYESFEATEEAQADWVAHVNDVAAATLSLQGNSWYLGANIPGKPRVFMPYIGGTLQYRNICDAIASDGYRGFLLQEQRVEASAG